MWSLVYTICIHCNLQIYHACMERGEKCVNNITTIYTCMYVDFQTAGMDVRPQGVTRLEGGRE